MAAAPLAAIPAAASAGGGAAAAGGGGAGIASMLGPLAGMFGGASSKGGSSSAPFAMPVRATGTPAFTNPITSQSVAPQGSITSGLANKQISPQILALLQKLNQGGGSA